MLTSYLKIAWRNLRKHRVYSLINVLGLAVGIAVCLLIGLYVQDELSYDQQHEHADRIYRVVRDFLNPNGEVSLALSHIAPPFGPYLQEDFPELEEVTRIWYGGMWLFSTGDGEDARHVQEDQYMFAEQDFFEVFTLPLVHGDPATALTDPNCVLLSEDLANRIFGRTDVVGETVKLDNTYDVKITGVFETMSHNTHLPAHAIASFATIEREWDIFESDNWGSNNFGTYILVPEGFDPDAFEAKLPGFLDKRMPTFEREDGGIGYASSWTRLKLQPLSSIHLRSHLADERTQRGDIRHVWLFSAIGISILILACVNFMNLATARSAGRAREVGLRKVIGANRKMLLAQFLGESMLITAMALVLAVILVELALPYFDNLIGRPLDFAPFTNLWTIPALIGVWLLVSLLAGFYPAMYLSGFTPNRILRGELTHGKRGAIVRKALVVSQFVVSVGLIVAVGVVLKQMQYIQHKTLGFETENIIRMSVGDDEMRNDWPLIKQRLQSHPGVIAATTSSRIPSSRLLDSGGAQIEAGDEIIEYPIRLPDVKVDADFFRVYDIPMVAGRDFDPALATDSASACIINETAARVAGNSNVDDAVGKRIVYNDQDMTIVGIVKDFHFESLHQEITPIFFYIRPQWSGNISLGAAPGQTMAVMNLLEDIWDEYWPNWPFQYDFLDQRLENLYRGEQQVMTLFTWFAGLAVFIACLGLLGLAAYTAERRTKEIGIRKTLGASAGQIIVMLNREFALLVGIATLIAWPLAWYGMNRWLETFAYRTALSLDLFLIAGVLALLIALAVVTTQALRAVSVHPVKALRHE